MRRAPALVLSLILLLVAAPLAIGVTSGSRDSGSVAAPHRAHKAAKPAANARPAAKKATAHTKKAKHKLAPAHKVKAKAKRKPKVGVTVTAPPRRPRRS